MLLTSVTKVVAYAAFWLLSSLVILEAIFQVLPVSDSTATQPVNEDSPVAHFSPNRELTLQTGFDFRHIINKKVNNFGYFWDYDWVPGELPEKTVAIIGDSYVEARQVANRDTMAGQLSASFNGTEFIPVGMSGAPLSQYLRFAAWVGQTFDPSKYIFLIIENDFDESSALYGQTPGFWYYDEDLNLVLVEYKPSATKSLLRRSAFIRYLFLDLKIDHQIDRLYGRVRVSTDDDVEVYQGPHLLSDEHRVTVSQDVIHRFVADLREVIGEKTVLFVLDADREAIYNGGAGAWESYHSAMFEAFRKACCGHERWEYLDLADVFKDDYERNGRRFDYSYDRHWNERGHAIAAKAIMETGFLD